MIWLLLLQMFGCGRGLLRTSQLIPRRYYYNRFSSGPILRYATTSTVMSVFSSNEYKRGKLDDSRSSKVIGTHSGTFQADEAMGCWMLQQLSEYRHSKIVRSRDASILETCNIVLDVGGVYDHASLKYDHHQRDYDERFPPKMNDVSPRCTKLSASGLIYRHYGKQVIQTFYPNLTQSNVDSLLEALDAIDTGVEMAESMLYIDTTGLASRVGRLNPRWNEVDEKGKTPDPDERFAMAVDLCGVDFQSVLTKIVESDVPARELVDAAVQKRHEVDPSGEIICLASGGLPWAGYLYELEKEQKVDPLIKFVLYTDQAGMWRVQAVTVEGKAFENRLSLPEEWRGVRDENLIEVTKIPGSRFVHAAGFIGGNDTYEGALQMALEALKRK